MTQFGKSWQILIYIKKTKVDKGAKTIHMTEFIWLLQLLIPYLKIQS